MRESLVLIPSSRASSTLSSWIGREMRVNRRWIVYCKESLKQRPTSCPPKCSQVFYFSPYKNTQIPFVKTPQNYYYSTPDPAKKHPSVRHHPPVSHQVLQYVRVYPCSPVDQSMAMQWMKGFVANSKARSTCRQAGRTITFSPACVLYLVAYSQPRPSRIRMGLAGRGDKEWKYNKNIMPVKWLLSLFQQEQPVSSCLREEVWMDAMQGNMPGATPCAMYDFKDRHFWLCRDPD